MMGKIEFSHSGRNHRWYLKTLPSKFAGKNKRNDCRWISLSNSISPSYLDSNKYFHQNPNKNNWSRSGYQKDSFFSMVIGSVTSYLENYTRKSQPKNDNDEPNLGGKIEKRRLSTNDMTRQFLFKSSKRSDVSLLSFDLENAAIPKFIDRSP